MNWTLVNTRPLVDDDLKVGRQIRLYTEDFKDYLIGDLNSHLGGCTCCAPISTCQCYPTHDDELCSAPWITAYRDLLP